MKAKFHGSHFGYTNRNGEIVEARHGDIIEIDKSNPLTKQLLDAEVLVPVREKKSPVQRVREVVAPEKTEKQERKEK